MSVHNTFILVINFKKVLYVFCFVLFCSLLLALCVMCVTQLTDYSLTPHFTFNFFNYVHKISYITYLKNCGAALLSTNIDDIDESTVLI